MSTQQSGKQGVVIDSQKRDGSRHEFDPAPSSAPVAGAFGKERQQEEGLSERPVPDDAAEPVEKP